MEPITPHEHLRRLLLRIAAYCPSSEQCFLGDKELLAANCQIVLDAANEGLEVLTGQPSNIRNNIRGNVGSITHIGKVEGDLQL